MKSFGRFVDKISKKKWSINDISKYVGTYNGSYLGYAVDPKLRQYAASGGSTTAILLYGLENGYFDGAVVCNSHIVDNKLRIKYTIETDPNEVIRAQGSKYVQGHFLKDIIPQIKNFEGKLAVVGLPCHLSSLKRWSKHKQERIKKIVFWGGFVCGHNSRFELIDQIVRNIEKEEKKTIESYKFRIGLWRGHLEASFGDGTKVTKPSSYFNLYQNLHFFSESKCLACYDHFAYNSDVTFGDVWLYSLKNESIKQNGIIARTALGKTLLEEAIANGYLQAISTHIDKILDGQSRVAPAHYNVSARSKAGKYLGLSIPNNVNENVKWHEFISGFITVFNYKVSKTHLGKKIIFITPKFILKTYLYIKKALESL